MSIVAVHGPTMLGGAGGEGGQAVILSMVPESLIQFAPNEVTITGTGFTPDDRVFDGSNPYGWPTVFVSETELTATIQPIGPELQLALILRNGSGPSGGKASSNRFLVPVIPDPGGAPPPPTLTSITPSTTMVSQGYRLTLAGSGFLNHGGPIGTRADIDINGEIWPGALISPTAISLDNYPWSHVADLYMSVVNPDGQMSEAVLFPVTAPVAPPTVTALTPSTSATSATPLMVSVTGTFPEQYSVVTVDGVDQTTLYVSSTEVQITALDVSVAGTYQLQVRDAYNQLSNELPLTVTDLPPDPTITDVTPASLVETDGPTVLTVTGTNFEAGSIVEAGGPALVTTFVSATSLTAEYDPTAAGTVNITVRNPSDMESNDFPITVTPGVVLFTPNTHTVAEVKEYIDALPKKGRNHPETQRVLDLERAGQNRPTLVAWLDAKAGVV